MAAWWGMQVCELGRGGSPHSLQVGWWCFKKGSCSPNLPGWHCLPAWNAVGLCLGCCCKVGFLFLGCFFFNFRALVSVCGLTHRVISVQTSGSAAPPASAHTCFTKLLSIQHTQPVCKLRVCLHNLGFFWPETRLLGGFLRLSKPIMVLGP